MDTMYAGKLETLISTFGSEKAQDLKRLGNKFIEEAAHRDDSRLANLSVISYALYKILSKDHFMKSPQWPKMSRNIISALENSKIALEKNDEAAFARSTSSAVERIEGIDEELSNFAKSIFGKAKIKQASTAYAMGLSLQQAAGLTGADRKDLQKYIGFTRIHDEQRAKIGIDQRMKMLRGLLK